MPKRAELDISLIIRTKNSRSKESQKLLAWGLTNFSTVEIAKKDSKFAEIDVWLGQKNKVQIYTNTYIYKTIRKARLKNLETKIIYKGPVEAPIKKDDKIAKLIITYEGDVLSEHDLLVFENIKKKNIISRILSSINYLVWGDV